MSRPTAQATTTVASPLPGARLLHTMLRVADLDRALAFYVNLLGMTVLRVATFDEQRFTLVFLGYGPEETHAVLELTYNWDQHVYEKGTAFGHIAIAVGDIHAATAALAAKGVDVVRPPGPLLGRAEEIIAFVLDPDGYRVELIQRS